MSEDLESGAGNHAAAGGELEAPSAAVPPDLECLKEELGLLGAGLRMLARGQKSQREELVRTREHLTEQLVWTREQLTRRQVSLEAAMNQLTEQLATGEHPLMF